MKKYNPICVDCGKPITEDIFYNIHGNKYHDVCWKKRSMVKTLIINSKK
jgi:hypothetical protein